MKLRICSAFAALLLLHVVSASENHGQNNKPYRVVCYTLAWAVNSQGNEAHLVSSPEIDPRFCTSINYSFARMRNNTIELEDKFVNVEPGRLGKMVDFRQVNPNLTQFISIGGGSDDGVNSFSQMVRAAAHRKQFINSVVEFLNKNHLDGIDIDWEFPAFSGRQEDKSDFTALLKEMNEAFKSHGFLISAAVPSSNLYSEIGFDIVALNKYLTYINLMTYDYHNNNDGYTGHNAPLFATSDSDTESIHDTVEYWIKRGAEAKKLILGIPLYGYGYNLTGSGVAPGTKATAGNAGGNYNQLCKIFKQPGWHLHWDSKAHVPFATKGHDWVSFDDLKSVHEKMEFVIEKKLGGAMVWTLDYDDISGNCGNGKYPMMKLMMKTLNHVDIHN